MKTFASLFFSVLLLAACKKENPIDPSVPLSERIVGTWQVTEIQYNGVTQNPLDTSKTVLFSGAGKNVSGHFTFDGDTNLGEFNIAFIAEVDLGLSNPLSFNTEMKRSGFYEVLPGDEIVRMTNLAGDSIYDWQVRVNKPNEQKWFVQMWLSLGTSGTPPFPVNVEATMQR